MRFVNVNTRFHYLEDIIYVQIFRVLSCISCTPNKNPYPTRNLSCNFVFVYFRVSCTANQNPYPYFS